MSEVAETSPVLETTTEAPKEVGEPQNSLTKQFTEAEWTALREFRVSFTGVSPPHSCTEAHEQLDKAP